MSTSKKVQPSRPVTGFCTAVIFEVLGSLTTIDSDVVRRVLPFVEFGLQPGARGGADQKVSLVALYVIVVLRYNRFLTFFSFCLLSPRAP